MVQVQTLDRDSSHHAVIKPERSTTKVRVVFNASSDTSNGQSINNVLHTGPVFQSDLATLILKWHILRYVFNADIEKMYRQIHVRSDHTPFQRILFRNHPGETIHDFKLPTGTFGVICASYLAIRILLQFADDVQVQNHNFMYVKDVLFGAHSSLYVIKSRRRLKSAQVSAVLSLRGWTNSVQDRGGILDFKDQNVGDSVEL
ncbi:uncharacterized protein [Musca autumnalis]|uniref:uncharacterized protein n=1 Tax=Musca autumnalis TaxID=221902 RepID=UPI003CF21B66